jgi:nitrogen regulatory protein PII
MTAQAVTVTVIAERFLQDRIVKLLEEGGATGYTAVEGSGKGRHFTRTHERPSIVRDFDIVRIEFVMGDADKARTLAQTVAETYFSKYSGLVYLSPVEVIRGERF